MIFLSLLALQLQAQNPDSIFSRANKNYNLGSYEQALAGYDSYRPAWVYILPNCILIWATPTINSTALPRVFSTMKRHTYSIPQMRTVQHNLRFAQNMTIDVIEELPPNAFDAFINRLSGAFSPPNVEWIGDWVIGIGVFGVCGLFAK
jgi:hypothetical protein